MFIDNYFLPMIGLPDFAGDVRQHLSDFGEAIDEFLEPIVAPVEEFIVSIKASINEIDTFIHDWINDQVKEKFGVDLEMWGDLLELGNKMDLASIDLELEGVGGVTIPLFKPGATRSSTPCSALPAHTTCRCRRGPSFCPSSISTGEP